MSHYKQQHQQPRNTATKPIITALTPQLQQSYNSLLNELHDYTLTQAFMENATSLQVKTSSGSQISSFSSIAQPKPLPQPSLNPLVNLSTDPVLDTQTTTKTKTKTNQNEPLEISQDLFVPSQKDTLFWCFYIIRHGLHAYTTIGNKHFLIEQHQYV